RTYFVGHTKLVKMYGAIIEKYTGGKSHIIVESDGDSQVDYINVLELVTASFIYNNKIFNNLSKYSKYPKFNVNAGMDVGEYSDYYIDDDINPIEYTSIGGVANNSAKIQSHAPMNYIYV